MESNRYSRAWLHNAERRGLAADVVIAIARRHGITPDGFRLLERTEEIADPHGKSFFLIPPDIGAGDARRATLLTYVVNADTGYGTAGPTDFPPTPYSAAEVARIVNRQEANNWSYRRDVAFVHRNGGRLVTTPNGMLMGLGGNVIQRQFSRQGGTAWGDIFMVNMGRVADPTGWLRRIVESGYAWCIDRRGQPFESRLDLDRLLHHEELHSQQWAAKGYAGMLRDYSWELVREGLFRRTNRLESDAGLSDGGYRA